MPSKRNVKNTNAINKIVCGFLEGSIEDATLRQAVIAKWQSNEIDQQQLKNILSKPSTAQNGDSLSDGPKRGKTGYLLFCEDERKNVMAGFSEGNPNPKSVVKELGRRWQELHTNNKSLYLKYQERALEDKQRYEAEKQALKEVVVDVVKQDLPKKRVAKKKEVSIEEKEPEVKKAANVVCDVNVDVSEVKQVEEVNVVKDVVAKPKASRAAEFQVYVKENLARVQLENAGLNKTQVKEKLKQEFRELEKKSK